MQMHTLLVIISALFIKHRCAAPGSYQHGNIRLVGGSTNLEGRVEVYISGAWATIDDNLWTTADAQVVCRQMGHSTDGEL